MNKEKTFNRLRKKQVTIKIIKKINSAEVKMENSNPPIIERRGGLIYTERQRKIQGCEGSEYQIKLEAKKYGIVKICKNTVIKQLKFREGKRQNNKKACKQDRKIKIKAKNYNTRTKGLSVRLKSIQRWDTKTGKEINTTNSCAIKIEGSKRKVNKRKNERRETERKDTNGKKENNGGNAGNLSLIHI